MENVTDKLETSLLLTMDANHGDFGAQAIRRGRSTEGVYKLGRNGNQISRSARRLQGRFFQARRAYEWLSTESNHPLGCQSPPQLFTRQAIRGEATHPGVQEFTIDGMMIQLTPNDQHNRTPRSGGPG